MDQPTLEELMEYLENYYLGKSLQRELPDGWFSPYGVNINTLPREQWYDALYKEYLKIKLKLFICARL